MNKQALLNEARKQGIELVSVEKVKMGRTSDYLIGFNPKQHHAPNKCFMGVDNEGIKWYRVRNGSWVWMRTLNHRQAGFLEKLLKLERRVLEIRTEPGETDQNALGKAQQNLDEWLCCIEPTDRDIVSTGKGFLLSTYAKCTIDENTKPPVLKTHATKEEIEEANKVLGN